MFPLHDNNPTVRFPIVTVVLIAINLLVFVWESTLPPKESLMLSIQRGFIPDRLTSLWEGEPGVVQIGDQQAELPANPQQIYLSLLTCMFLHASWGHVLGNMWFLWLFGNNVEDRIGRIRFLIFYLLGGLIATGCHWYTGPESGLPVVGASGAVSAVLGAYAVTWPKARVRTLVVLVVIITVIELPALAVLGFWFAMQLLDGLNAMKLEVGGGVAFWAHIGGFVAGCALIPLFKLGVKPPLPRTTYQPGYPRSPVRGDYY